MIMLLQICDLRCKTKMLLVNDPVHWSKAILIISVESNLGNILVKFD